jgi:chromosomal replication initiation ATPase DnaA
MTPQLPLPFDETPTYVAEDFFSAPSNALAQSWLEKPAHWTNGRMVLWGEPGCGKSFLLHLWAQKTGAIIYPASSLHTLPAAPTTPIAIDDADQAPSETTLLHLLNAAAQAGQPVLLTARHPPSRQTQQLADLTSRLRASLVVEISPPDEPMLRALLVHFIAARQLTLAPDVTHFLLSRLPRTPAALREAVTLLDHAALATGKKITVGLAANVLSSLLKTVT